MAKNVNDATFKKEVLDEGLPVLVDFWAAWCGPCTRLAPVIEYIAKKYEGKMRVCKLNVDEAPKTASRYDVMSIPTCVIFKKGRVVDKVVGALPQEELEEVIKPHI